MKNFKNVVRRCLGDWLELPIVSITKEMVISKHSDLTKLTKQMTSGKAQANLAMEILGILMNFAAINYEVDGEPIIKSNPVRALSQIRAWHKIPRRQSIIPEQKLAEWYQSLNSVRNQNCRDYLLLLLLTGLRKNEAATLKWVNIDFDALVLTVKAEHAKNQREHRLPLSKALAKLLVRRKQSSVSEYVFPGQRGAGYLTDISYSVRQISARAGFKFTIHDLRRNFLTAADLLGVPYFALKKLANHTSGADVTTGYVVVEVERLREYMEKISDHFLEHLNVSVEVF